MLDQSQYPELPEVPDNKYICFKDTALQNQQMEWVAEIIITFCTRKKSWQAISLPEFIDLMCAHPHIPEPFYDNILQTLKGMIDKNWLTFLEESEALKISPELANIFL